MKSLAIALVLTACMTPVGAQVTERVSLGPGYQQATLAEAVGIGRSISRDGRFVCFSSSPYLAGWNLSITAGIMRDRLTGTSECVTVDNAGVPKDSIISSGLDLSRDARFVAFCSVVSDVVPGDTNGVTDVFLRDRIAQTTERVSISSSGVQANAQCGNPSITDDGRFVAFISPADSLVAGDVSGTWDVFVRDRALATTELVSISSAGIQANGGCGFACISDDGRYVAFTSAASNLVSGDTNGRVDAFVHDRQTGVTKRASVATSGAQSNGDVWGLNMSADGRFIAFMCDATNLVPGDTNGQADIFVRDLRLRTTECASVAFNGFPGNGGSRAAQISEDGRFVSFTTSSSDLIQGFPTPGGGVFVRDRLLGSTEIASIRTDGLLANNGASEQGSISADGRFVAFVSDSTDLVPNDTNGHRDVFLHDRLATGATSLCHPGLNTVSACPCTNPPSDPGRGCDNSSSTGGAYLQASGIAYLSLDTLVFTTHDELPHALSILLQSTSSIPQGVVFGQGVRCGGGALLRLFTKTASGGSILAPDANTNDPSISARCLALGAPIQVSQPHLYLVYYRDPSVLGTCPATSTFNATQTLSIGWWP